MTPPSRCPCGSGEQYVECCGRFHSGASTPATATELMRSRFSAFARSDATYLLDTWDPATRPPTLDLDDDIRWHYLEIVESVHGGPFDDTGIVQFRAHYRRNGVRGALHERSTFIRRNGRWLYVDGDLARPD